ncbi:hypothetical protein [Pigmentiphaga sp. NML030171]|nr:hypothetical protein [Pigmentiphaga sp. NML030171]
MKFRGKVNIGDDDALMCVMLGSTQPQKPTCEPDDPLSKVRR